MNILSERRSLIGLWLESFKVVNRCAGKLLGIILVSIALFALAAIILVLMMGTSGALAMLQMGKASQAVGIGAAIAYLLFTLGSNVYGLVFCTVCWRLFANQARGEQLPLTETFSGSVVPAIYQIAASFVLAIPMILLGIICAILMRLSAALVVLLLVGLFFGVIIRLFYSFIAIAVANKGPIEGFTHSWKMTAGSKNYIDTLLACLVIIGSVLLMYLFFAAITYGFAIMIPLHFANSFNLAQPSLIWILLAVVLGILALFAYFVIMAFPVLVFINRNAVLFDARTTQDSTFVPLPELELPNITPNPEHMQQAESTVRVPMSTEENLTPIQTKEQPAAPVSAPQPVPTPVEKPQPQDMPALDGLKVSKSSINTSESETDSLSEHLDKVYKPQKEDIVQYSEEDRMPTILFDDEMAKQLQENQTQYAPKSKEDNSDKKDEDPGSIKMSKF